MPMEVHDAHYRRIESRGVEPIEVMETIVCNGIPPEFHQTAKRNLHLAQAAKCRFDRVKRKRPKRNLPKHKTTYTELFTVVGLGRKKPRKQTKRL